MSKLSEFHVGVLDVFGILLPGAIATAVLEPRVGAWVLDRLVSVPQGEVGRWGAFLVSAYVLGHVAFMVGSVLDPAYDRLRRRLAPGRRWRRAHEENERAYACASRIRDTLTTPAERAAVNTFQWARSVLIARCPAAAEDVHRLEADSKFFRSLLVVSALSAVVFAAAGGIAEAAVALALVPPCFARYYGRRLKSTTQAYVHVVALHGIGVFAPPADTARDAAQAHPHGSPPAPREERAGTRVAPVG